MGLSGTPVSPVVRKVPSDPNIQSNMLTKNPVPVGLQLSVDALIILIKLTHMHQMTAVVDVIILLLAEFAGVVKVLIEQRALFSIFI